MRLKNTILNKLFSQNQVDLRAYPRFPLVHDRIGYVSLSGHPLGRIRELSYGGFSVELEPGADAVLANATPEKRVTIQLLDGKLDCLAIPKSESDRFLGFAFVHESIKTYEFLHRYLPFMKFGAALRYMIHNDVNPKKLPQLLTSDDTVRASFDIDGYDDLQVPLATIEMTENGLFYKLVRDARKVQTWHSIGIAGASGNLRSTPSVDPVILRKALSFLVGYVAADYQIPVGKLIQSLLDLAENEAFLPPYPKPAHGKVVELKRKSGPSRSSTRARTKTATKRSPR